MYNEISYVPMSQNRYGNYFWNYMAEIILNQKEFRPRIG